MVTRGDALTFLLFVFLQTSVYVIGVPDAPPASSRNVDVRQTETRRSQLSRCVSCSVNGKLYDGHSRFQYEEGCYRYRCICRCDGSWECPAQHTEDICGKSAQEERQSQSGTSSSSSSSATSQRADGRCRSCLVNGQEYQSRSYFTFVQGCLTIDNCICHCNGSWVCPKERARSTCNVDSSQELSRSATWTVDIENSQSRSSSGSSSSSSGSSVRSSGSSVRSSESSSSSSGSSGSSSGSSVRSSESSGSSSGSSVRSSESSGSSSGSSVRSSESSGSSSGSSVRSSESSGSSSGSSVRSSESSGSSSGSSVRSSESSGSSSGSSVRSSESSGSSSGSGSGSSCSSCGGSSISSSSLETSSRDTHYTQRTDNRRQPYRGCQNCTALGKVFRGNSYFELEEGCRKMKNCICYCNGSWNCPDRFVENTCGSDNTLLTREKTGCRSCSVKGKTFTGNQYFQLTDGCIEYRNCICNCDGSWNCPGSGARNICEQEGAKTVDTSSGSRCRQCEVKGQVFPGNQYFELTDGCMEYKNCICRCDGSWSCPDSGARDKCRDRDSGTADTSSCRNCQVYGSTFPGNQYFQVKQGCIEYKNCLCRCDGSWTCPGESAKNICVSGAISSTGADGNNERGTSVTECLSCLAFGKNFKGGDYFDVVDGCTSYKNCVCRCDGSWDCNSRFATNICSTDTRAGTETRVSGTDTRAGTETRVSGTDTRAGTETRVSGTDTRAGTETRVSGTDTRAGTETRVSSTDTRAGTETRVSGTDTGASTETRVSSTDTRASTETRVSGTDTRASTDTRVSGTDTRASTDTRVAGTDTRASTDTRVAGTDTDTRASTDTRVSGTDTRASTDTRVAGTDTRASTETRVAGTDTRASTETRVSEEQRTESRNTPRTTSDNQCSVCNARNKVVQGNSYFEMTDGCTEYKNCLCRCDGSWECPSQYARNICTESPRTASPTRPPTCSNCQAMGKIIRGNSYFELIDGCTRYTSCRCNCDGQWDCPRERASNICFGNSSVSDSGCSLCQSSDGRVHQPNSQFQLVENCIEYNCDCFCNGSWNCPGKRSRWICHDKCLQCDVNGRKVQNDTQFVHRTGCLEYTCNCHCNGSWSCPGSTVRNACPAGVRDNCNKCQVSPTEVYEGESDFVLKQDCLHYKCRCNCDGSYNCPGKDARNVCRGEVLGGCRTCAVSETEFHRGDSDFTMRKDCIHYECRCNCDGSWECPAERARNICLGESPGGCRACRVSETEIHRPNTVFDMRKECINYKCKCNCDGSWSCPGEDARDVCKGELPGGCRSCMVTDNEFYPGNSNFEMVKNCIHYKCRCNCDGSYSCPGRTARRVCQGGTVAEAPTCRTCKISDREQFAGNTTFSIERGCTRYECQCRCDGSWQCPPGKSRDICSSDASRVTKPARCSTCKISNEVYPGDSSFKFSRGCSQFDCKCDCYGQWSCDYQNPTNICRGRGKPGRERSLTSDASAVRTRQNVTTSGSSQVATQTSERGRTFVENDIRSQEVSTSQDQHSSGSSSSSSSSSSSNRRTSGSSSITSYGSSSSNTDSRCRPCPTAGVRIEPNGVISLDLGCQQAKNCKCQCDGRWKCAQEVNVCNPTEIPVHAEGQRSHRTEQQSSISSSSQRQVDSSAWVFVDGVDTSFKTSNEKTGGGYVVRVDTKYSPKSSTHNEGRQQLELLESQPSSSSSSSSFSASGSSSVSSSFTASGSSPDVPASSSSFEVTGKTQCLRCQADSKTYPAGANFDMRRGCVVYKCLCLCSGSYRCRLTSDNACSMQDKQNSCSNCLYQGMVFPGNMGFTVREGCDEKQCNCNCDGTHACHTSKTIPGCTDAMANLPGFPGYGNFYPAPGGLNPAAGTGYITNSGRTVYMTTCTTCKESFPGPVVYHTPVRPAFGDGGGDFVSTERRFNIDQGRPREACAGCIVDGQARNGNSTFSFEKDCMEFECFCACGGSWKCSGRLATDCTPGFAPGTIPHTSGCRGCLVQGTTYPANARFSLRQGCHEYQCSCNCDGGWSCPAQHPVNLCPVAPSKPGRGSVMDPQIVREDVYVADQSVSITKEEKLVKELGQNAKHEQQSSSEQYRTAMDTCQDCVVRGVAYPSGSKFFLRDGCVQRTCQCHCNRTWSCSESTVDVCMAATSDAKTSSSGQCKECRVGSEVFVSDNDFQINNGCYQHNCYCYCNGTYDCRPDRVRNICLPRQDVPFPSSTGNDKQSNARALSTLLANENGGAIAASKVPGCKDCYEDGRRIEALTTFVKQLGCYESLCHCQCNGKSSCPLTGSVNVCQLPDKKPMNERKGCQVGRRTHFTRVFAHVEDCIQRTCVCHDNGEWSCKRTANDIKVC